VRDLARSAYLDNPAEHVTVNLILSREIGRNLTKSRYELGERDLHGVDVFDAEWKDRGEREVAFDIGNDGRCLRVRRINVETDYEIWFSQHGTGDLGVSSKSGSGNRSQIANCG
jgi:hypothetical protein